MSAEDLKLMRLMDELHLRLPFYGSRRLTWSFQQEGYAVGRTRVQRLMRQMGIEVIYPRPRTSEPHPDHRIYPYLLRNIVISEADQVWSADITYVPMRHGFMYLVAILDWHSRYVLAWRLSNTLDGRGRKKGRGFGLAMGRVVSFESAHSWYVSFPVYFPWSPSLGIIPSAVLHSFFQRLVASARNWVIFPSMTAV